MNKRSIEQRTDFNFIALLILIFAVCVCLAFSTADIGRDIIILALSFIPLLFAYFSTLSAALTVCAVTVLGVAIQAVTLAFIRGTSIAHSIYFFIIWTPLMTIIFHGFTRQIRGMQKENGTLKSELNRLVTIDAETGLKNLRAFENDAVVYMNISRRYEMDMVMIVWQLRYPQELLKIVDMPALKQSVSAAIRRCLRREDAVYIVDDDPLRWGVMLFTNIACIDIVLGRVTSAAARIDVGNAAVTVELDSGLYSYDRGELSALALLNLAKAALPPQNRK